ncbi:MULTISPECIES: hypothetical protein [Heyndrickxia]|uniref:hypothetical protein n=1 Tax=Heyndrickxia TaxID=2837504 RepID=UPI00115473A0|nr:MULTISPECIES: hypothetical protein [Heyndrickxia]MEC2222721.1 hypothetical protein [Weizmannia sp. CD-2023]QPG53852.1 hypothetical protein IR208_01695 [Heyndrickxia coagulans]
MNAGFLADGVSIADKNRLELCTKNRLAGAGLVAGALVLYMILKVCENPFPAKRAAGEFQSCCPIF